MNWYGIFTVLLISHVIAIVMASVAGYEYRVNQQIDRAKSMHPATRDSDGSE